MRNAARDDTCHLRSSIAAAFKSCFLCAFWFATKVLARMSDSLVRVSRRVFSAPCRQQSEVVVCCQKPKSFYLCNFRHYLTLFSKYFSTFPHGTCSLSVSRMYLALDGIYHQIHATISCSTTPKERENHLAERQRDFHPHWYQIPKNLFSEPDEHPSLQTTTDATESLLFSLSCSCFARCY